jgi:glycosyltransferase 2 family protein
MLLKRFITILQFLFFLGLGIFLVWWMARGIDENGWKQIRASVQRANFWLFLPVLLMMLLSHFVRALRWKILMEPLGYKPSTMNIFNAVMIGYLANLAFPRLGEVLKCTILARYEKMAPEKLIGTIVAERAVDVVCLLLAFTITILLQIDTVGNYAWNMLQQLFTGKDNEFSWTRLLLILALVFAAGMGIYLLLKKFSHLPFIGKIRNLFNGIWSGLTSIGRIKNKKLFIGYSVFMWFLYLMSCRLGFYAMEEVSHLGLKESFSILSFGSIGMILTQGGIGAYQLIVQEILVLYGQTEIVGFTFGWILWIAQTVVILFGGLICFILLPIVNRRSGKNETSNIDIAANNN